MSRRFAAALLAATVLASPALADLPTPKQGWRTGAMRAATGEFAYCVSEAEYTNGLWLILALNPEAGVNLGMGVPGATWSVGAESSIAIQIEGYPAQTVKARITKPGLMVVSAGSNPALIEALSRSNSITIDGKAFALKGSGRAIAELRDCVDHKGVPPSERGVAAAAPAQPAQPPLIQQGDATSSPTDTTSVAAPAGDAISAAVVQPLRAQYGTEIVSGSELPGARGQAPSPFAPPSAPPEPSPFAPAPSPSASAAQGGSETSDPTPTSEVAAVLEQAEAPVSEPVSAPVAPPSAPAAAPASASVAAPVASVPAGAKPLPAQLLHLLTTAGVRDLTPASEAGAAFAWRARGVKGHVVEMAVSPNTDLMQLVRRHQADLGAQCNARYSSAVGTVQSAGPVTLLTADSLCRGSDQNTFTTFVYALSRRGVLSIISHEQLPGADGTANRIQSGLVKALKETQG